MPGAFGAFLTIVAKKKESIKLACFVTIEVFILLLIGALLGWKVGNFAITHYTINGDDGQFLVRFFIGGFGFVIFKEFLDRVPFLADKATDLWK